MGNKYIEKFFLLTEQNIIADAEGNVEDRQYFNPYDNSKLRKYTIYVLVFLLFGLIYLLFHSFKSNNHTPKQNDKRIFAVAEAPVLSSFIPGFRVAARRQVLQQVYLKKTDVLAFNSVEIENDYRHEAKVTDKVLVVPKYFG